MPIEVDTIPQRDWILLWPATESFIPMDEAYGLWLSSSRGLLLSFKDKQIATQTLSAGETWYVGIHWSLHYFGIIVTLWNLPRKQFVLLLMLCLISTGFYSQSSWTWTAHECKPLGTKCPGCWYFFAEHQWSCQLFDCRDVEPWSWLWFPPSWHTDQFVGIWCTQQCWFVLCWGKFIPLPGLHVNGARIHHLYSANFFDKLCRKCGSFIEASITNYWWKDFWMVSFEPMKC